MFNTAVSAICAGTAVSVTVKLIVPEPATIGFLPNDPIHSSFVPVIVGIVRAVVINNFHRGREIEFLLLLIFVSPQWRMLYL